MSLEKAYRKGDIYSEVPQLLCVLHIAPLDPLRGTRMYGIGIGSEGKLARIRYRRLEVIKAGVGMRIEGAGILV
jgi:hypothetical protein